MRVKRHFPGEGFGQVIGRVKISFSLILRVGWDRQDLVHGEFRNSFHLFGQLNQLPCAFPTRRGTFPSENRILDWASINEGRIHASERGRGHEAWPAVLHGGFGQGSPAAGTGERRAGKDGIAARLADKRRGETPGTGFSGTRDTAPYRDEGKDSFQ